MLPLPPTAIIEVTSPSKVTEAVLDKLSLVSADCVIWIESDSTICRSAKPTLGVSANAIIGETSAVVRRNL